MKTLGVLAGAYLRGDDRRVFLTHVVRDDGRPLCGKVKPESICPDGYTEAELAAPPTCPVCRRKDPRCRA